MDGEILDVYDENRVRTGRTHVRGRKVREGDFIMVVHVWIMNGSGDFLIQKRQPWKELFPGMWDCAVAGAAHAGDSSEDAAVREAKEELDLDLDMSKAELVMTDRFSFGFDDIWLVRQDLDIDGLTLQAEEVETVKWARPGEIRAMAEKGEFIKYYYLEKLLGIAEKISEEAEIMFDDKRGPIEHYSWARFVVFGKEQGKDIFLYKDKVRAWKERQGHELDKGMVKPVFDTGAEILIIGNGADGVLEVPQKIVDYILDHGIKKVLVLKTPEACAEYNRLYHEGEKVALLAHGTC